MHQRHEYTIPQTGRVIYPVNHRRKRIKQYIRGDQIGKGKYGVVFLCEDQENDDRQMVSNPPFICASAILSVIN